MLTQDTAYYRERTVTERALALKLENQEIADIHEELARLYQALVDHNEFRPPLRISEDR